MTAPPTLRNAASSLPAELLSLIYEPLSQPDLLAAAAVSSSWRASAIRDRNYYRAWTYRLGLSIFIDLGDDSWDSDRAARFDEWLSQYAPRYQSSFASLIHDDEAWLERNNAVFRDIILPNLVRALPRVVALNLYLYPCSDAIPLLLDCLTSPTPALHTLEIRADTNNSFGEPASLPLPANFLAQEASRLKRVSLTMAEVSPDTPTFPSVRCLQVAYPFTSPGLDVVRDCFPNLRHLDVRCLGSASLQLLYQMLLPFPSLNSPVWQRSTRYPSTLVLSNGLALADDAHGPGIASLFSEILCPDPAFYPSLECVARAATLIAAAARKKVEARQSMDRMVRVHGPGFHWEECSEAKLETSSAEDSASQASSREESVSLSRTQSDGEQVAVS
ncbi:hypothetical protein AURDEDRAFT_163440 [Auricularia subglabra TFB-10046 SS5]|nr:hypothetical protein AURDEDRAFT_163440 [Auricularia subglabra TFB-10046 SS5]